MLKFRRYIKGGVVAYTFDDLGSVGLRYPDGRGLLRTSDGIPRPVVGYEEVTAVADIFACIVGKLDRDACLQRGVEVEV